MASAAIRLASSAATTNDTLGVAGATKVTTIVGMNTNAAVRFLKLYNKATQPTVGTDTPLITLALPASAAFAFDFAADTLIFPLGVGYGLTTAAADNSTAAVGAGDIVALNILYR